MCVCSSLYRYDLIYFICYLIYDGEDEIINEYIKSTVNQFINVIFDNGIMPSSWLIGMMKPIYKNKGDKCDPKNYRPITIVSCKIPPPPPQLRYC